MREAKRNRKQDINYLIQLNEEQKETKKLIIDNQIVIVTGFAGTGKSLVCAQAALDFLFDDRIDNVFITRATIEVGKSLGYLPGGLDEKFDPYIEAFIDNLHKCYGKDKVNKHISSGEIKALPIQFIRGKTIDDFLIVEEAQNLSKHEMLAILTRLGKTGKIVVNGDISQKDVRESGGYDNNGLEYAIELSKKIPEIKHIKLKENHRSDLVGKILDYEYGK